MQLRTLALREPSIRGIEYERVRESPSTTGFVLGLHETARVERRDGWLHPVRRHLGGECLQRRDPEPSSLDRGALEDEARHRIEAVEPGGEERLQRRRDLDLDVVATHPASVDEEALIREHRRELLDVERVALGRFADPVDDRPGVCGPSKYLRDPPGFIGRKRRKGRRDRPWLARRPGRALLEKFGASETQEEHGRVQAIDDGVHQVEHRRLGPVRVFEHHDERTLGRQHLEQSSHRPRGVGADRFADTEELRESVCDRGAVRVAGQLARGALRRPRRPLPTVAPPPARAVRRAVRT